MKARIAEVKWQVAYLEAVFTLSPCTQHMPQLDDCRSPTGLKEVCAQWILERPPFSPYLQSIFLAGRCHFHLEKLSVTANASHANSDLLYELVAGLKERRHQAGNRAGNVSAEPLQGQGGRVQFQGQKCVQTVFTVQNWLLDCQIDSVDISRTCSQA